MAPKAPYRVHSLNKHIEDTNKGLSAESQYNKRPVKKAAPSIKKEPGGIDKSIFGNDGESDVDGDGSSSSSSSDEESDFLRKLAPQAAKTSPNTKAKKPVKNEEISDSDTDRKSPTRAVNSAAKKQPVKPTQSSTEDSSSSESESDSEPTPSKGEQKVKVNGTTLKTASSSSSTSTSASESGSEDSESEDESKNGKAPSKKIATSSTDTTSSEESSKDDDSSDDSSGSSSEDESDNKTKKKSATKLLKQPVNSAGVSSTSDSTSSEDDSDSKEDASSAKQPTKGKKKSPAVVNDESSDESEENDADESMHIADREHDSQVQLPNFIAPDFILRKGEDGAKGQDVARICNEANLQGKQVWYFTVPANIPISVVQNLEIPMSQGHRGDRVFSHEGDDYGVSFDGITPKSSIQILIPSADGARYQSASRGVDQVMQVKKITQLGEASINTTSSVGPAPKPAPRAQPKGLKARYQPLGVNTPMGHIGIDDTTEAESDVDMIDAPVIAQMDKKKKNKKNKQKEGVGKKDSDTSRKGKRKHASSEDDAEAAAVQLMEEQTSAETKSKKQKTQRSGSPDLGSDDPSSPAVSKKKSAVPAPVPSSTAAASTPKTKSRQSKTETKVPVPTIPGSAQQPKVSPVPIPQHAAMSTPSAKKDEKRAKKKKDQSSSTAATAQQSPPPSAQPSGRTTKSKVTPVPMPSVRTSG